MLPQIAAGCDRDISNRLLQELAKAGVDFKTSCKVTSIAGKTVEFVDAVRTRAASAGGLHPERDRQGPGGGRTSGWKQAGVDFDRKGIKTSDRGKTNVPGHLGLRRRDRQAPAGSRRHARGTRRGQQHVRRRRAGSLRRHPVGHLHASRGGLRRQDGRGTEGAGNRIQEVHGPHGHGRDGSWSRTPRGSGLAKVLAAHGYGEILGVHVIGDPPANS